MRLSPFLYSLAQSLSGFRGTHFVVAISGGFDSMVLAEALRQLKTPLDLELTMSHVHHGPSAHLEFGKYRAQAFEFVKSWCQQHQLNFIHNVETDQVSPPPLSESEADLREYRREFLLHVRQRLGAQAIVTAHHADDLFETRLLRLLRGTGSEGLEAMRFWREPWLRPFLSLNRSHLESWATSIGLSKSEHWLEDPSNQDARYLRNWVRKEWLVQLETHKPGATTAMSRSLEQLAQRYADLQEPQSLSTSHDANMTNSEFFVKSGLEGNETSAINRREYLLWSQSEQARCLMRFLRHQGLRDFGHTHVQELQKRLRSFRREFEFRLLGRKWTVNAEQISVESSSSSDPAVDLGQ